MKTLVLVVIVALVALSGCGGTSVSDVEQAQQATANAAIVQNQPVPDLGGFSFERQIVIETYLARNNNVATYTYLFTLDGKIIEVCPSIGYPIPYSTQVSNPEKVEYVISGVYTTLPNAEPNGLYPPGDAAATLVSCVGPDGSVTAVSPGYIEQEVMAFPYRIKSDFQLEPLTESTFSVDVSK